MSSRKTTIRTMSTTSADSSYAVAGSFGRLTTSTSAVNSAPKTRPTRRKRRAFSRSCSPRSTDHAQDSKWSPHLRARRLYRRARGQGLVLRAHVALRRYARDEGSLFERAQRRAHDRARTHQRDRQPRHPKQTPPITGEFSLLLLVALPLRISR